MTDEQPIKITETLFLTEGKRIESLLRQAVKKTLLEHKRAGYSVALWRNGRAEIVPPEEIEIPS